MARARQLIDTSAATRLHHPEVAGAIGPALAGGLVALCRPVLFELGYSARTADDHRDLLDRASSFELAPTTDGDHARALEVQGLLAARAQHRAISLVDALVAAVAESRGLVVLHYDKDFDLIADVTGQPMEWVVPQGTVA